MRMRTRALCLAAAAALACATLGLTQVAKAPTVTVVVDQHQYQVSSSAATVGDLLIDLGITLGDLDRTTPSLKAPLVDRGVVRVTRVSCRRVVEEAPLSAKTILLAATDRPAGSTETLSPGRDGRVRRVVEIWEKDGQVSGRNVLHEQVLTPAEDRVILRSTPRVANRGGDYRRARRMRATAYDPSPLSCGPHATGRTATGVKACKGVVAVDTRVIPFGTRLYIPGYGFAVAADRGSAIKGNRIDLCFDTYDEAVRFGSRWVDVYVVGGKE